MTKRTASELWDALDEATADSELESMATRTPEEHRRELAGAGYDLDKVHADADAFFASMPAAAAATPAPEAASSPAASKAPAASAAPAPAVSAPPAPPAVSPLRPRRMRPAVVVPIALALAAAVALVIRAASPPPPVAHGRPDDMADAADLRREAQEACRARSWKTCLDRLDEARALDPSGDTNPEVQSLRHTAAERAGHP
jgi:hypothetical protein